ncbi:MAG: sugar ABC transporter substrate-binding protein [Spirochaetaceae bacterium]|nr:sugar ABC transporter substrate-binding protein [Spirochaetaceae bacterium]
MKRAIIGIMILAMALIAVGSLAANGGGEAAEGGATTLTLWSFQEIHVQYYQDAVDRWNAENPDRQIVLDAQVYPYDDMHNKLLLALQSGSGAPDIVDIELGKYPLFLKGTPQLVPMNDYVEPEASQFIMSRFDIYSKNGQYYGVPFHVGASVIYYNTELLESAGIDYRDIKTWDDYVAAGIQLKNATGKPMVTVESTDIWSVWPLLAQAGGDFFDANGKCVVDNAQNTKVFQFLYDMVWDSQIAIASPGGFHHAEEYYGFMNDGGAASVWMPMWYMGRFTDYMPDLKGKIVVAPMPEWPEGGFKSAGMGGTGTSITNQSKNIELAQDYLYFAKMSKEANVKLWEFLGFDPPRWDVWDDPRMNAPNKFTDYFQNDDIFGMLLAVKDSMNGVRVTENLPRIHEQVKTTINPQLILEGNADVRGVLTTAAADVNR